MSRRLLGVDGDTATYWHRDPVDRRIAIEVAQDVAPYLRANRLERTHETGGARRLTSRDKKAIKNGWVKMASIPNVVITKWMHQGVKPATKEGLEWIAKQLDKPEWAYLKTNDMRLGKRSTWH